VSLRDWDQGYFFSIFDSYDLRQPADALFDRDLARLGSFFFYYVAARHRFLFYTRSLVPWFARLGFAFYIKTLRSLSVYSTLLCLHPRRRFLFAQRRRLAYDTLPYNFYSFFEPYARLLALGFTVLSSLLPGLYEDAALHDVRGVGGGRIPKQLPGAADYQRYREFEPHHIRDMCLAYYELPWGEGFRERRSFFLGYSGFDHSDRLRSVLCPVYIRIWPRFAFVQRAEWWALWGVDWRGCLGWDALHVQSLTKCIFFEEGLASYVYSLYRARTPRLLSYFYFSWHRLQRTHFNSFDDVSVYAQARSWGDSRGVRLFMAAHDKLLTVFKECIRPAREHNQLPVLLRSREGSFSKTDMFELLHYTDPFSDYALSSDAPLACTHVLTFNLTNEDYDLQPQSEFFMRTTARAHEDYGFSYDGLDLIIVAALVVYWAFRFISWFSFCFFMRLLWKQARRERRFFSRPNFDHNLTEYMVIVPQVLITQQAHRPLR
jgi:hypothetical protein